MAHTDASETRLEPGKLRPLLEPLFRVRASVYWTDFLLHALLGYGAFVAAQAWVPTGAAHWALLAVAGYALYRAVLFIHEIAHFRTQLPVFTAGWNLLCGAPLAMPSFLYYQSHFAHHGSRTYGTPADGEYIPFARQPRLAIVRYVVISALAPVLMVGRFLLLVPMGAVVPKFRRWLVAHGSSLVIEAGFVGKEPMRRDRIHWLWQETATSACWWAIVALTINGTIPLSSLAELFGLMSVVHVLNAVRTLAAHRFESSGEPLTLEAQYLDSVNLSGGGMVRLLNVIVAPVGLRYHALHHLFPMLPYHSLGAAHRKLVATLPATSPYHRANENSPAPVLARLWERDDSSVRELTPERA